MKLTKKKAVSECKKLWKEIEESGLGKEDFLRTLQGEKWLNKEYDSNCPLCDYVDGQEEVSCSCCPIYLQYDMSCSLLGYCYSPPDKEWFDAVKGLV